MKTPHVHAAVIHAWADGAEIESRPTSSLSWMLAIRPSWDENYEYRIKPEPKPDIVWYVNIYKDGIGGSHKTLDSALAGFEVPPFGTVKITINGETGKTSAEVV